MESSPKSHSHEVGSQDSLSRPVGAASGPGCGSSLSWWMEMEANGADSSDPSRELGHPIQIMTVVSIFGLTPLSVGLWACRLHPPSAVLEWLGSWALQSSSACRGPHICTFFPHPPL